MNFLDRLLKISKAALNEALKPESFYKGEEFENYVRKYIFPSDRYELLHRTHSYTDNKKDYIESTLYPDFLFRCKRTGREFFVEAKFRSRLYDNYVEWTYPSQLKRYHEIDSQTPVFLCLGLYGKPKNPEFIFVIPVSKIKYTKLYPSFLEKFEFYPKKPIFNDYLWRLLER